MTVFFDLAIAVFCGVVASSLAFAWEKSEFIQSDEFIDQEGGKHYQIKGPLFFGSAQNFQYLFNPQNDPKNIYIDFKNSKVCDYSSIEMISNVAEKYQKLNKRVHVTNLSPDCAKIIKKAGNVYRVQSLS